MADSEQKHYDLPLAGLCLGLRTPQELTAGRVAALPRALGLAWVLKVFLGLAWFTRVTHLDHKHDGWDQTTDRSDTGEQIGTMGLGQERSDPGWSDRHLRSLLLRGSPKFSLRVLT